MIGSNSDPEMIDFSLKFIQVIYHQLLNIQRQSICPEPSYNFIHLYLQNSYTHHSSSPPNQSIIWLIGSNWLDIPYWDQIDRIFQKNFISFIFFVLYCNSSTSSWVKYIVSTWSSHKIEEVYYWIWIKRGYESSGFERRIIRLNTWSFDLPVSWMNRFLFMIYIVYELFW